MKALKSTLLFGMISAAVFSSGNAASIIGNFSIAQGFTDAATFNTTETSSVNVLPVNFTLSTVIVAAASSQSGFAFPNGDYGIGGLGANWSAYTTPGFLVTLDATYVGGTPGDAAPIPNYKVQLNITSISIRAAAFAPQGDSYTLGWTETTPGNTQSQSPQSIETNPGPNWLTLANWDNLAWAPAGFQNTGLDQSRTFGLAESNLSGFALDGFLVTGNIVMTYDAVPEPSTMGLIFLAAGVVGFSSRRRKTLWIA